MKKIFGTGLGIVMMAVSAVPALAFTNVNIGTTGPWSWNHVWVSTPKTTTVTTNQMAVVANNVTSSVNTGGNASNYNTVGGNITTGNASSNTTVDNHLNSAITQINDCNCTNDAQNVTVNTTGPYSQNTINITSGKTTTVTNGQDALALNNVTHSVNTGGNVSSYNTVTGGGSGTGSAGSVLSISNWLNSAGTFINVPVIVGP